MIEYRKEFGQADIDAAIEITIRNRKYRKAQIIDRLILFAIGAFWLVLGLLHGIVVIHRILIGCAFVLAAFLVPYFYRWRLKKHYKKSDPRLTSGTRQHRVDESGIESTNFSGTGCVAWDAMESYGEYENYIWVTLLGGGGMLLFDKTVLSAEDVSELRRLLSTHIVTPK